MFHFKTIKKFMFDFTVILLYTCIKAAVLYQHDKFYREVSLQESHYSFLVVYDHDWAALKIF